MIERNCGKKIVEKKKDDRKKSQQKREEKRKGKPGIFKKQLTSWATQAVNSLLIYYIYRIFPYNLPN